MIGRLAAMKWRLLASVIVLLHSPGIGWSDLFGQSIVSDTAQGYYQSPGPALPTGALPSEVTIETLPPQYQPSQSLGLPVVDPQGAPPVIGTTFVYSEEVPEIELGANEMTELLSESVDVIDGEDPLCDISPIRDLMSERYRCYKSADFAWNFMPGDGDQFGWAGWESTAAIGRKKKAGLFSNFNMHLLSGPEVIALPPRLYDFVLGYQKRERLSQSLSYDVSASVGVYSDFEDSARDGVRYPAHAVGIYHASDSLDYVLGVDYLSRDDIKILPVFGFSWHSSEIPNLRLDLVFPRPRIDVALNDHSRVYWTARLGGGTWDIEMPGEANDVFTYRDYQVLMGIERFESKNAFNAWEFGFVFGRHIQLRNSLAEANFDESFVLRHVSRF
jgi:hypothetical protein